ncbi:ankyrin repeat protein [Colletotrichum incanum]|uniref:Ankyrin repeat protein n=1 Tax=Colletotrichum incanum TaxID=1573173 RepID=A0A166M745_COLIC|nr:ankyrin repeat protein [Colletotrichum incanum]
MLSLPFFELKFTPSLETRTTPIAVRMPPRAKKADIKDEEWKRLQPVIQKLYLIEDKSLKDVLTILSMYHSFRPSKAQLEWKLKQWHMTKNMTSSEWKYVAYQIRKRHVAGKESVVCLSGVRLRDATMEKARSRHCYETAIEKSMGVVAPSSPTDLSLVIRTPSPQRVPELWNMHNIPWLSARSLIKDALQVMLFLLSNNFLDRQLPYREEHDRVIKMLLHVLPQTDGWVALMSQKYAELPVSIQSALDRLFKEVILKSDLNLVRSLTGMGVDANQALNGIMNRYGILVAPSAFEYATMINDWPLIQLLVELKANPPIGNMGIIESAWKARNSTRTTVESMAFLLSNFAFRQEDDVEACQLLAGIDLAEACPITEQIFEFFRTKLHTPESKSQLLTAAIIAHSRIVLDLLSEKREHISVYINHLAKSGITPMMAAIGIGDTELVRRLLRLGTSLDIPSPYSTFFSPLQYAAFVSDVKMLREILRQGADLNHCHPSNAGNYRSPRLKHGGGVKIPIRYAGKTALQIALLEDKPENAMFLLAAGANLIGCELAIAISLRQHAIVNELLIRGASYAETSTIPGTLSVLEAAVLAEDMALISRIVDDNSQTVIVSALWPAILVAKFTSDLSTFKLLFGRISAPSELENLWLGTAMYLAATIGDLRTVELMLASGLRPERCLEIGSILKDAFIAKKTSWIVYRYCQWREDILQSTKRTLMEVATDPFVLQEEPDFMFLLYQSGYHLPPKFDHPTSLENLEKLHSFGVRMTPQMLSTSIQRNYHDVTEWLLVLGFDVNRTCDHDDHYDSPVQAAAGKGNLPLVERLINLGADINAPARVYGATALQAASMRGYFGLVRRLLELQADPNAPGRGWTGRTALEGAAENGKLDVVQLLLNSGVQTVGSGRRQYVRAIGFARLEGHHALARLIKSHRLWEQADQKLIDDKDILWDEDDFLEDIDNYDSDEKTDEYESSKEASNAEFEASEALCEAAGENIEVDKKVRDSYTSVEKDEDFPEISVPGLNDVGESCMDNVDERTELPGDAVWAEKYESLSSELPWLFWEG